MNKLQKTRNVKPETVPCGTNTDTGDNHPQNTQKNMAA